jgi:hypothetical protein
MDISGRHLDNKDRFSSLSSAFGGMTKAVFLLQAFECLRNAMKTVESVIQSHGCTRRQAQMWLAREKNIPITSEEEEPEKIELIKYREEDFKDLGIFGESHYMKSSVYRWAQIDLCDFYDENENCLSHEDSYSLSQANPYFDTDYELFYVGKWCAYKLLETTLLDDKEKTILENINDYAIKNAKLSYKQIRYSTTRFCMHWTFDLNEIEKAMPEFVPKLIIDEIESYKKNNIEATK